MRIRWALATLLAFSVSGMAIAQEESSGSEAGQVSYILGYNLGTNLNDDPFEIDLDRFIKGFRDALEDAEPELTDAQMQEIMMAFQQRMLEQEKERMEAASGENAQEGAAFLDENGKRDGVETTASGLQYEVVEKGEGAKPGASDTVTVHYTGTLIDGTKFDSSHDRGQPATFPVNGVIPGWTEALQLMPVGSTWKLFIPSELAYGERGAGGVIGPNETLLFDVELISIEP
jgi:FKBP-type peptidyl-prolyl cis-trans isomerase FklB